jgi:hypothetical protein
LIDNGCHLVLIRPDIIEKLGLIIFPLESPENINLQSRTVNKKKRKMQLENFVILKATSIDQQWCSKCVCAIITPNLCMPVIFGLPFLLHNNIFTDHSLCSCIDKKSNYNLINPITVLPPKKIISLCDKRKKMKRNIRDYVKELKEVCNERLKHIKKLFEVVNDANFIGAIKACVTTLNYLIY